jgi:putative oxidoreductase
LFFHTSGTFLTRHSFPWGSCFDIEYLDFVNIEEGMQMLSDLGLLVLRVAVGVVFLGHGAQKGFGSFGGPGFAGASGFFGSMGFRPARFWTGLAVGGELVAGVLLLLGLLTPVAALLVVATMAVAVAKVHGPKGFFVQNGGYEYNVILAIAALALAATGPGAYSLDHLLGLAR